MKKVLLILSLVVVVALGALPTYAATIDLGFALDESGSVGSVNYNLEKTGLANALPQLLTDTNNQYRISVVSFATNVQDIVNATILTAGNLAAIQGAITGNSYTGGNTNIAGAVSRLTQMVAGVGFGYKSLINISTDGVPNVGDTNGVNIRNTAVAAGWDSISAEAIGSFNTSFLEALVYPQPAVYTNDPNNLPNPLSQGFVLAVSDFNDYGDAIAAKIQKIQQSTVPEPSTLLLLGGGLLGLIGFGRKLKK